MQILLTRALAASEEMAKILESEAGGYHQCLIEPLLEIEPLRPKCDFAGVAGAILTSANGVRAAEHISGIDAVKSLPLYGVGARTGQSAAAMGWQNISDIAPTALELVEAMRIRAVSGRLIYLAGVDRAHDLDGLVPGAEIETVETYHAQAAEALSAAFFGAFARVEAVTLFSSRTAEIFLTLIGRANLQAALGPKKIYCLSENIAALFVGAGYRNVVSPEVPTRAAMIDLLNK